MCVTSRGHSRARATSSGHGAAHGAPTVQYVGIGWLPPQDRTPQGGALAGVTPPSACHHDEHAQTDRADRRQAGFRLDRPARRVPSQHSARVFATADEADAYSDEVLVDYPNGVIITEFPIGYRYTDGAVRYSR